MQIQLKKSRFGVSPERHGRAQHPRAREEELLKAQMCCGKDDLGELGKRECSDRKTQGEVASGSRQEFRGRAASFKSAIRISDSLSLPYQAGPERSLSSDFLPVNLWNATWREGRGQQQTRR